MNDRRIEKNIISTNMIHGMMYENELGMNSLSIHHMKSNIDKDKYLLNLNIKYLQKKNFIQKIQIQATRLLKRQQIGQKIDLTY